MNNNLRIAKIALQLWIEGLETNNWEKYLAICSDDYSFKLPKDSLQFNSWLPEANKSPEVQSEFMTLIKNEPSRVLIGDTTVAFEFIKRYPTGTPSTHIDKCKALSFDIVDNQIAELREYYCEIPVY